MRKKFLEALKSVPNCFELEPDYGLDQGDESLSHKNALNDWRVFQPGGAHKVERGLCRTMDMCF